MHDFTCKRRPGAQKALQAPGNEASPGSPYTSDAHQSSGTRWIGSGTRWIGSGTRLIGSGTRWIRSELG